MTDYLRERLDNAEYLLEQMRRADQSGTDLLAAQSEAAEEQKDERRSPQALFRMAQEEVFQDEDTVDDLKIQVNQNIDTVDNGEIRPDSAEGRGPDNGNPLLNVVGEWASPQGTDRVLEVEERQESGAVQTKELGEDRSSSALAAALEQMDWAVTSRTGGMPSEGRRGGFPVSLTGPRMQRFYPSDLTGESEAGWNPERSLTGSGSGGGRPWVEQADRAFRRDSRRYDGGFYLY